MIEYLIYGAAILFGIVVLVAVSIAKAKIGWSWINEKEE